MNGRAGAAAVLVVTVAVLVALALSSFGASGHGSDESQNLRRSRNEALAYLHLLRYHSPPGLSPTDFLFGDYRPCEGGDVRYVAGTSWTVLKHRRNPAALTGAALYLAHKGWPFPTSPETEHRTFQKGTVTLELVGLKGQATIDGSAYGRCFHRRGLGAQVPAGARRRVQSLRDPSHLPAWT